MVDWDRNSPRLRKNLRTVLEQALEHGRSPLDAEQMRRWHATIMSGLQVPDDRWVGAFRGSGDGLHHNVEVAGSFAVLSTAVAAELQEFDRKLGTALDYLDAAMADRADLTDQQIANVVNLCAWTHADWVRIHPFVNGSGRTARLWANAIAMRYWLPPFVALRPRPDKGYASAARKAMGGDWEPTIGVFSSMLDERLSQA